MIKTTRTKERLAVRGGGCVVGAPAPASASASVFAEKQLGGKLPRPAPTSSPHETTASTPIDAIHAALTGRAVATYVHCGLSTITP